MRSRVVVEVLRLFVMVALAIVFVPVVVPVLEAFTQLDTQAKIDATTILAVLVAVSSFAFRLLRSSMHDDHVTGPARLDATLARPDMDVVRHEAAHAVVFNALGSEVVSIDMKPTDTRLGRVTTKTPEGKHTNPDVMFSVMAGTVAGHIADLDHCRSDDGSCRDLRQATLLAAGIMSTGRMPSGVDGSLTTDTLMMAAFARARTILAEHADSFDALVETLTECRIYSAEELAPILCPELSRA